ncbi:MAG TPA: hypothetical protein VJR89_26720 [Polyangiales bacterium]|nr:hypothetical protein [Polyangiales bacterium]
MSTKSRRPTMEHTPAISVVVIGGPDALVEAVRRSIGRLAVARVVGTDVAGAATQVASTRPFALVISEEIYGFDSAEFDALARDVQASVITVPTDGVPARQLQERLDPRILDAYRTRFGE